MVEHDSGNWWPHQVAHPLRQQYQSVGTRKVLQIDNLHKNGGREREGAGEGQAENHRQHAEPRVVGAH